MNITEKERTTEKKFLEWLNTHNIPFLYIDQTPTTFSAALRNHTTRRPDFMIFIPHIGWILTDVEYNSTLKHYDEFPVGVDETHRYCELQKLYNLQVWYVFSHKKDHWKTWYWIPAAKAMEKTRLGCKGHFYTVSKDSCITTAHTDSLTRILSEMSKFF